MRGIYLSEEEKEQAFAMLDSESDEGSSSVIGQDIDISQPPPSTNLIYMRDQSIQTLLIPDDFDQLMRDIDEASHSNSPNPRRQPPPDQ